VTWIWWVGLALAGRNDTDRANASAAASSCHPAPPEGYRNFTGYAVDKDAEAALQSARADAWFQAERAVCGDDVKSDLCVQRRGHILQWQEPQFDKASRRACFTYQINQRWLEPDTEYEQVRESLAVLARSVVSASGGAPVRIASPTWSESGCVAGEAGRALHAGLLAALGREGRISLSEEASQAIELTLTPSGKVLTVVGRIRTEDGSVRPLPGFDAPAYLYPSPSIGREGSGAGDCRWDSKLGLDGGARVGEDGLQVSVNLGSNGGVLCEGSARNPRFSTTAAADLRVLSVGQDGTGYLLWPPSGERFTVTPQGRTLSPWEAVLAEDGGVERIVVVASREGAPVGDLQKWRAPCRLPSPVSADTWGRAGTAVGTDSYVVVPAGERGCAMSPGVADRREANRQVFASLPVCE